ncbi:protein of unknown function [Ruminococcaceae bacterium YRB3002]|nr:protein of unknown function [Ruminococcaceae bacterium YRB3002]
MALGLFIMLIILIVLAAMALLITGIVFVVVGFWNKKKGGKGTKRTIGIVLLAIPLLLCAYVAGRVLLYNSSVKCVADEWRYKPFFMPRNSVTGSNEMLRELLESADDEDEDKIYREFAENVRDDRYFEDTVDDFFDKINDLDVELDPDDFLKDYGKDVHLEGDKDTYLDGRIYSAGIDGETYYCYVRICITNYNDKDDVGLQQFIVCTEDKVDELYGIIEEGDVDIYLYVL